MKYTYHFFCISIIFLIFSCSENSINKEKIAQTEQSSQADKLRPKEYCFRNETFYNNDDNMKDVEELKFSLNGDSIKGTFAWIPAEKDGLSGKISGIKKNNIIHAVYDEINSDKPFAITISLSSDSAQITSQYTGFGSFTIKKSNCNN